MASPSTPPLDPSTLSETEKQELIAADALSISSSSTKDADDVPPPYSSSASLPSFSSTTALSISIKLRRDVPFVPTKALCINATGIPVLRLPLPPSELETPIYNENGTRIEYISRREKKSSGNCVLLDGNGAERVRTSYWIGPGRDPEMVLVGGGDTKEGAVKTMSKWTSRTHKFMCPDGKVLSWEYARVEVGSGAEEQDVDQSDDLTKGKAAGKTPTKTGSKRHPALLLSLVFDPASGLTAPSSPRPLAVLLRTSETRTPGSFRSSAGNGGKLFLGPGVGESGGVAEDLVVASCLLMLKKEIDRRRFIQAMMVGAAVS